jgi:cell wall-associated NlpC family hydrolase
MQPYFSSIEKILRLQTEARSWLGTPFAAKAMVKGAGADCIHLIAGIYLAVGAVKEFVPGDYTLDEGNHLKSSKVIGWFASHPDFVPVAAPYLVGDVVCFNLAAVGHHVGMVIGPEEFIHVYAQRGRFAIVSNLCESFYTRHIVGAYRLTIPDPGTRNPDAIT